MFMNNIHDVRCDIDNDKDVQVATMDSNYYYIS